jgi:hypothetical protein
VRSCQNEVEQPDGTAPLCTGTLTFGPGDLQAKCDTCGAWEGVNAPRPGRVSSVNEERVYLMWRAQKKHRARDGERSVAGAVYDVARRFGIQCAEVRAILARRRGES